jgi:hypothetical protein
MAQVAEHLPSKSETLSSNLSKPPKKKKKKKKIQTKVQVQENSK